MIWFESWYIDITFVKNQQTIVELQICYKKNNLFTYTPEHVTS